MKRYIGRSRKVPEHRGFYPCGTGVHHPPNVHVFASLESF